MDKLGNSYSSLTRQTNRLRTSVFLLFLSLLVQSRNALASSKITFCYNTNGYEGENKTLLHLI